MHGQGWPSAAPLPGYSEIFPSGLTYRTQSLNLKLGAGGGRGRNQISMDGEPAEALYRTQHMHIFPCARHPGGGRKGASRLQPLLSRALIASRIRGGKGNFE